MPVVGDEPNIIDDNSGNEKSLKIECIKFFVNSSITKNIGDTFVLSQTDSVTGISNNWYSAKSDKTVLGFTTFVSVIPTRTASTTITPSIISGSWEYDGQTERFKIPLLSPIYSNDNIKCSLSGKTSNRNSLVVDPNSGTIDVSREV